MNVIINSKLKCIENNKKTLSELVSRRLEILGRNYNYKLVDSIIFNNDMVDIIRQLEQDETEQIIEEWNGSVSTIKQGELKKSYSIYLPTIWLYEAIEYHKMFNLDTAIIRHVEKINFYLAGEPEKGDI